MLIIRIALKLAACALLMPLLAGCNEPAGDSTPLTITGAGSTFAAGVIKKWSEEYHKRNPGVVIRYEPVGSGEGESRFLDGSVDFGGTDAGLATEQLASIDGGALQIPITAGIIVLAYNPEGLPRGLKLSREVYADAFLGKSVKWNDDRIQAANPGKELPDQLINIVVRQDSSGTTFAFTNHLSAVSEEWLQRFGNESASSERDRGVKIVDWPGAAMNAPGNSGVAGRIQRTLYSLGYVQYGAAREVGLGMASLENKAGNFIPPSGTSGLETLLNAQLPSDLLAYFPDPEGEYSYPIVTFTWLLVRKQYDQEARTRAVQDFVRWCLTNGQDYSEAAGNVRLAPHVVRTSERALDTMQAPPGPPVAVSEE